MNINKIVKVSVNINHWAVGAGNSLNGLTGKIITFRPVNDYGYALERPYLVELDDTPKAWSTHQRPSKQWWFSESELTQ